MTQPVIPSPSTPFLDSRTGLVRREWFLFLNALITANVTSVGVTGANGIGVSGSPITSAGTIALSLGAITPSSVAATGTVTGSNISGSSSGTNTGDQTITLTGDVTGSGTGSFAATIAANAVTFAKFATTVLAPVSNVLAADVNLNNIANYFDGPSVAQGATGTWLAVGTVTVEDTAGAATFIAKMWDGTNTKSATRQQSAGATARCSMSLAGIFTNPPGNIRISVRDPDSASGLILANNSGLSVDSTLLTIRIG